MKFHQLKISSYNPEIYNKLKQPNIVKVILSNKIQYLGHLFRLEDYNPTKMLSCNKAYEKIKFGRPTLRWLDNVEKYFKALKITY